MTWLTSHNERYLINDEALLVSKAVLEIIRRYEIDNEFKTLITGPFEKLKSDMKIKVLHIISVMLLTDTGDRHLKRSALVESAVYYVFMFISNEFRVNHSCAFNEWGKYIINAYRHYPDGRSVHEKMIPKSSSSFNEWEFTINELADRILLDKYFEMQDTCLFMLNFTPLAIRMPVNTDFDYFSNSQFDNFSNSIVDNLGNKVAYSENAIEDLKRLCLRFVNITSATNISSSSSSSSSNLEVNINKRKLSNDGENSIHSDKKSKIAADVDELLVNTSTPKINNNISPASISSAVIGGFSESRKRKWTAREEEAFKNGVKKHGIGNWKPILADPEFKLALISRSNVNLKDKFKTMQNQILKKYEEDYDDHGDEFTRLLINHYFNKELSYLR